MVKYVERPEVIEAIQFKGFESLEEVKDFMGDEDFRNVLYRPTTGQLVISDDYPDVKVGYYIVKDFRLGYFVMRKEEFESRYVKEVN